MGSCRHCGVPRRFHAKHEYLDNGIIVTKGSDLRGIFIERALLRDIIEGIESRLGIPIERIVIDAKRRDAKLYVDDVLSGLLGRILRLKRLRFSC